MANTTIQILRSYSNTAPSALNDGELAYSFVSDKLFIGNNTNDIITIGGNHYVDYIDAATPINTPDTIVLRDSSGMINVIVATVDGGSF